MMKNSGHSDMKQKLTVYYDKQCPFCKKYAAFLRLKEHYDLELRDAREYLSEIHALCKDININDGIIVSTEGKCLQGIDALSYLDTAIKKGGVLSRIHGIWNVQKPFRGLLYSTIKVFRKIVLFVMGRKSRID